MKTVDPSGCQALQSTGLSSWMAALGMEATLGEPCWMVGLSWISQHST